MRRTFVEAPSFSRRVEREGPEVLRQIQDELLKNLEAGKVIQGTGGLRKLRIPDASRGKGKRGGYRVIYLDLPHVQKTFLLLIYGKDEKDDISSQERRVFRVLVAGLKEEANENGYDKDGPGTDCRT